MILARAVVALLAIAAACKGSTTTSTHPAPGSASPPAPGSAAVTEVTSSEPAVVASEPRRSVALVTDAAALAAVADAGGSLAALLGAPAAADTAALAAASPRYAALADTITADIAATAAATPGAGVGVRGHRHRLFDAAWLRSPRSRFDLVGIAPRLDRARLPHDCGDVRLIYRLGYETTVAGERVASRVPMTISVSLGARPDDAAHRCRADAEAWRAPESVAGDPAALGRWLVSDAGPLGARALDPSRVVLVLSNLQVLRTPAASAPSLGGHAEYRLRAFVPDGGALALAPLENTPDVARIRGDAALRAELLAWLRDEATLDQIDRGVHRLPAKLLATEATSVSPFGLARAANRSFGALVARRELEALPLAGRSTIASVDALLRRLDEQTCHGCHQVRSVAGFHLVGTDPPEAPAGVALAIAYSPLVAAERARRAQLIDTLADGRAADFTRPTFATAEEPPEHPGIGDACEPGRVVSAARGARLDRVTGMRKLRCGQGLGCTRQRGGFPGGMCQATCDALPEGAVCGVIAVTPFNECLGRAPFSECLQHVRPIGLAACDHMRPCRDDYVCARTPAGDGACLPPYFLFPLRVDGHPPLTL